MALGRRPWPKSSRAQERPLRPLKEPRGPLRAPEGQALADRQDRRAYLLKEQLRQVFQLPPDSALHLLDGWIACAQRSRLDPFRELAKKIRAHRQGIASSLRNDLSNAIVESTNTKIRVLTRVAFGFHSPAALIALAMLSLGGCCPALPHA